MLLVWLVDWLLVTAVLALVGNWSPVAAGGATLALLVALTVWAASSLNERLTAFLMGARRPVRQEESQLAAALAVVEERLAGTYRPRVLVLDRPLPLAWALGRRTVLVTAGLLPFCGHGELAGVLAHEAGHQLSGHATRRQILRVLGLSGTLAGILGRAVLHLGVALGAGSRRSAAGQAAALLCGLVVYLFRLAYLARQAFLAAGFRREEYAADTFAARLGLGGALSGYLGRLAWLDQAGPQGWRRTWLDHPSYGDRVARLADLRSLIHCTVTRRLDRLKGRPGEKKWRK